MKTVMKKMFCLMLVAVLMVGVMPFQAFATETACPFCNGAAEHCDVCDTCLMGLEGGCPNACQPAGDPAGDPAADPGVPAAPVEGPAAPETPAMPVPAEPAAPAAATTYKVTINMNYEGGSFYTVEYEAGTSLYNIINATVPVAPTRSGYVFDGWMELPAGTDVDASSTLTGDVIINAMWSKVEEVSPVIPEAPTTADKYTVYYNLNYNEQQNVAAAVVDAGTAMGTVLTKIPQPTRTYFTFAGWYWDAAGTNPVYDTNVVTANSVIYAKWNQTQKYAVTLKVFTNGGTNTCVKIVDLYNYSLDGKITLDEVKVATKDMFKANTNDGLIYYGPFSPDDWDRYCINTYYKNNEYVNVNPDRDTTVYVMIHNVEIKGGTTTTTGGAVADSSNPKTGDMIFMPATVLGLSATALAVLFILNKKRAY